MNTIIRSNWKFLKETLEDLDNSLQIKANELAVNSKLRMAREKASELLNKTQTQSLYIVGSINIAKTLNAIINHIDGMKYGLQQEELTASSIQPILQQTRNKIKPMLDEVASKIEKQQLNKFIDKVKAEATMENYSTQTYKNFTDAMQTIMRRLENETIHDVDKSASRDLLHMSNIMKRNEEDLQKMKVEINKAYVNKQDKENFHIVYGPVLTGATLDANRLKAANVDFDIVYYPGVRYNFVRKEATPRMFILRNQLLVAVIMKNPNKFHLKLKGKSLNEKIEDENTRFKDISLDVTQLLQQKLGTEFVQVGAELGRYITNRNFPGIRFMLLMRRSIFNRIGAFSSSNILELPF